MCSKMIWIFLGFLFFMFAIVLCIAHVYLLSYKCDVREYELITVASICSSLASFFILVATLKQQIIESGNQRKEVAKEHNMMLSQIREMRGQALDEASIRMADELNYIADNMCIEINGEKLKGRESVFDKVYDLLQSINDSSDAREVKTIVKEHEKELTPYLYALTCCIERIDKYVGSLMVTSQMTMPFQIILMHMCPSERMCLPYWTTIEPKIKLVSNKYEQFLNKFT